MYSRACGKKKNNLLNSPELNLPYPSEMAFIPLMDKKSIISPIFTMIARKTKSKKKEDLKRPQYLTRT
jgi:hypothetical protein